MQPEESCGTTVGSLWTFPGDIRRSAGSGSNDFPFSTTSSVMTLTGETQPLPLSGGTLLLVRFRKLLSAQGGCRAPVARALSEESEPTGTAAGLTLAVAQSQSGPLTSLGA